MGLVALVAGVFALVFARALIASRRKHPCSTLIFLLNLFFGWTFVGWLVLLVWALSGGKEPEKRQAAHAHV